MNRFVWLLLVLPLGAGVAMAAAPPKTLPAYLTLPPSVKVRDARAMTVEDYGEAEFRQHASHDKVVERGKHWAAPLALSNPPPGPGGKASWATIKPSLLAGGWTVPDEYDENPFSASLRYQKDGKDVWGFIEIFGPSDMRLQLIEAGAPTIAFTITPPSATPEKISDKSDFPYLPPLPGTGPGHTTHQDGPMQLTLPGSNEMQLVGSATITKDYKEPPGLSNAYFAAAYHAALTGAGWTIVVESEGVHQGDAVITAHYAKNGRDIWATLHRGNGTITIKVADAADLTDPFEKDCHVALYGVLFDFNKATLKAESDSILQRVLAMLQKQPALKVEVQGHTDNVGSDAYNQTLSEARARSVMAWLTAHGIAPLRLTAKGYGETMPVASNSDDAGRAKNRRVEIAKPGCSAR